jgi:hypothetical protein
LLRTLFSGVPFFLLAEHRGFQIVKEYEDQGISGGKGRGKRPAFDLMLKDAMRRRFGVLLVWSMDRLGRSVLHVAQAMAELDAADWLCGRVKILQQSSVYRHLELSGHRALGLPIPGRRAGPRTASTSRAV